jgi:pyruvate dehydrogenase E2 component (dihydrolipoamide acetyltransferase)/2-oxoisovalerate dehydrogenase E2 component (dihydrolipoyl transacylase)
MDFALPEIGEGVYEAELVRWLVKPGEAVKRGQALLEVMTDKATMEVPAPFVGTITALRGQPGQPLKVGEPILSYTPAGQPAHAASERSESAAPAANAPPPPAPAPPRPAVPAPGANGPASSALPVKAAPSVRYLARRLGIDLGAVAGSGPQGRILVEDLTSKIRPAGSAAPAQEVRPDYGKPGTRLKVQGVRKRIAEHLVQAKRTIPHYSYVDECDVTELVRLRAGLRDAFAAAGVKLTYLAFIVKAVVAALKEVPLVNASLDEPAGEIVLHDRYHVGVAVATPAGLLVPVIHDADRKDLAAVAREIERLSNDARAGRSRRDDLRGGTFTVTSVGNIGGLFSTPVINHPEVGILGVGKVVKRPVYDEAGHVRPADLVYLSFSFDHRVVDGAVGAAFANAVIAQLQNPAVLLLPEKL